MRGKRNAEVEYRGWAKLTNVFVIRIERIRSRGFGVTGLVLAFYSQSSDLEDRTGNVRFWRWEGSNRERMERMRW
jgi:hypothetical protein